MSHLFLEKHLNFNSSLLCEAKCNFWKGLSGQRAGPCSCQKSPSIIPLILLVLKKFTSDLLLLH